jgi:hypothetical protein
MGRTPADDMNQAGEVVVTADMSTRGRAHLMLENS